MGIDAVDVTPQPGLVAELCQTHLGVNPDRIEVVVGGNYKATYRVALADDDVVYVLLGDETLRAEIALHRDLADRDVVPVPPVRASGCLDHRRFFVTAAAPGTSLTAAMADRDDVEITTIARTLGRYLARLHEAYTFSGHGTIEPHDGSLVVADPADARTSLMDLLDQGLTELPPALADLRGQIPHHVEPGMIPLDAPATLYPWDFRPGNMRWHDGAITGILDWGRPRAAPAALAVAKAMYVSLDWFEYDAHRPTFLSGYRSVRPLTVDPTYWRLVSIVAIVRSAVDRHGAITRPYHPMSDEAVAETFHRRHLERYLAADPVPMPV